MEFLSATHRVNKSNYEIYNIGNGKPIYLKKINFNNRKDFKKEGQNNFFYQGQKGDMISTYASTCKNSISHLKKIFYL